jgi:Sugar kinases, ribokinase family
VSVTRVVSLGSINVDRVRKVRTDRLADLEVRYDWFPGPGETVTVEELPVGFAGDIDRHLHGGKGANQAIAARSAGAEATLLGTVGPDHEAFGVLEAFREAGVGADQVGMVEAPTGTAEVFVDPDGENRIVVQKGANDEVDAGYIDTQYDRILAADVLLIQNEGPVEPVAELLDRLEVESDRPTIVLDPAPPRGVEPLLHRPAVDYVTPNDNEYRALGDALDSFGGTVIHKRGSDPISVEGGETIAEASPPAVDPIDTTGAGDVLNGFLGARLAAGDGFPEALELAVVAASLSTTTPGARGGIPTLDAVRAFTQDGGTEE